MSEVPVWKVTVTGCGEIQTLDSVCSADNGMVLTEDNQFPSEKSWGRAMKHKAANKIFDA